MSETEVLRHQQDLMADMQSELKANFEDLGLIHNGKPTDEGAIVLQGKGQAPSPQTAIQNTHTRSSKKSKKNKKKKVDPTKPTDEDIKHKQLVVEDVTNAIKSGEIHLNHVPLPEENHDDTHDEHDEHDDLHDEHDQDLQPKFEIEPESGEDDNEPKSQMNNQQNHHEVHEHHDEQQLKDEESPFDVPSFNHSQSKSLQAPTPSVLSSLIKFSGIVKIVPLVVRCAINTIILYFITKIISFYSGIFSRLYWFQKKIENFLPLIVLNILVFSSNIICGLSGWINGFVEARKQENEEKIQQTYELILNYCRVLSRDFREIEDSVQEYSPTLRIRDNLNLMLVLSVHSFLWFTLPFFEFLRVRIFPCKKEKNINV